MMQFSPSSLNVFAVLLNSYSLPSGTPNLVEAAMELALARDELMAALADVKEAATLAALTEAKADV